MTEREELYAKAARRGLSRVTLAAASMKAALKTGQIDYLEAWLLAAEENHWVSEISDLISEADRASS